MKKLMFLISTEGKTAEQIADEAFKAYRKYKKVEKKVKHDLDLPSANSKKQK